MLPSAQSTAPSSRSRSNRIPYAFRRAGSSSSICYLVPSTACYNTPLRLPRSPPPPPSRLAPSPGASGKGGHSSALAHHFFRIGFPCLIGGMLPTLCGGSLVPLFLIAMLVCSFRVRSAVVVSRLWPGSNETPTDTAHCGTVRQRRRPA